MHARLAVYGLNSLVIGISLWLIDTILPTVLDLAIVPV